MPNQKKIKYKDIFIRVINVEGEEYFCITDMAKEKGERADAIIQGWMTNKSTFNFLGAWESQFHTTTFKSIESNGFKGFENLLMESTTTSFILYPSKWIKYTNAKGIISKKGRYGGTYAHTDIAFDFAGWINANFKVFLISEFRRLKQEEQLRLGDPFASKRNLAAGNHSLLMAAIFSQVDERLLTHPQPYKSRLPFASEVDMINKIVFGNTAKEWRLHNTDKPKDRNQRDYATVIDLVILNNLEFLDAMLLQWDCEKEERQSLLQQAYDFQYPILKRSKTIKRMQELANKLIKNNQE